MTERRRAGKKCLRVSLSPRFRCDFAVLPFVFHSFSASEWRMSGHRVEAEWSQSGERVDTEWTQSGERVETDRRVSGHRITVEWTPDCT